MMMMMIAVYSRGKRLNKRCLAPRKTVASMKSDISTENVASLGLPVRWNTIAVFLNRVDPGTRYKWM